MGYHNSRGKYKRRYKVYVSVAKFLIWPYARYSHIDSKDKITLTFPNVFLVGHFARH